MKKLLCAVFTAFLIVLSFSVFAKNYTITFKKSDKFNKKYIYPAVRQDNNYNTKLYISTKRLASGGKVKFTVPAMKNRGVGVLYMFGLALSPNARGSDIVWCGYTPWQGNKGVRFIRFFKSKSMVNCQPK